MKNQYISPLMIVAELQGVGMISLSPNRIDDTPSVKINQGTMSSGNAGSADVKEYSIWDDE
jgi:hypothetical protein